MKTLSVLTALLLTASAQAADPVHNVQCDDKPLYVKDYDTGTWYSTFKYGYAVFAWQEGSDPSFAHATAIVSSGDEYEFRLETLNSNNSSEIEGEFDVTRNGVLVCDDCIGKAYGLSGSVGDYFKIYVGTPAAYAENWHFSGYITDRFDY